MAPGHRVSRTFEHLESYYEVRILAGETALEHGEAKARAIFKRKRGFVHYWKRKVFNYSLFTITLHTYKIHLLTFLHIHLFHNDTKVDSVLSNIKRISLP
jgi:hypothetical protein